MYRYFETTKLLTHAATDHSSCATFDDRHLNISMVWFIERSQSQSQRKKSENASFSHYTTSSCEKFYWRDQDGLQHIWRGTIYSAWSVSYADDILDEDEVSVEEAPKIYEDGDAMNAVVESPNVGTWMFDKCSGRAHYEEVTMSSPTVSSVLVY